MHEPFWTATARHADIVLPVTTTLERDDLGISHGDTHLIAMKAAAEPYAGARDEYDIFTVLAERLGYAPTTRQRHPGSVIRFVCKMVLGQLRTVVNVIGQ